jgi:hypothetical protein
VKAFVTKLDSQGRFILGTSYPRITPQYISLTKLKRFFLSKLSTGNYLVEVFYNWDNRYGKPSVSFNWTVKEEI